MRICSISAPSWMRTEKKLNAGPADQLPEVDIQARLVTRPAQLSGQTVTLPEQSPYGRTLIEISDEISGDIHVVVKLSRNASVSNRRVLAAAGLHWHGRLGRWTGKTNTEALESLRSAFGERVEARALALPVEEAGPERVDAPDSNASVLDADVKAIAADLAETEAVEPGPNQSAATASLRVPLHSLRGFPRVRPLG